MYEKIAWDNFCKTGDIESFLEYRKLSALQSLNNIEKIEVVDNMEKGDVLSEFNKIEGDNNKGNNV